MTSKPTPSTSKKTGRADLSQALQTVPAIDGIHKLRELHHDFGIIPSTAYGRIAASLDRIETVLREQAITTLELAKDPSTVLSILTGVPRTEISRYHSTEVSDRLHTDRNLLLAVTVLAASTIAASSPCTSPQAVYSNSVKLTRRTVHHRRPCTDDEIVLFRVASHLAAQADPRHQTATIYTYLEAGAVPAETTHVTIADHDDPENPRMLRAAGNQQQLAGRDLPLDTFANHLIARHITHALRAGHDPNTPMTYTPRVRENKPKHQSGSNSATASAQRTIDRFFIDLRLPTGDITASSITQWRVATTLNAHGIEAAWTISGRTRLESMYRALGTFAPPTQAPSDEGVSFAA